MTLTVLAPVPNIIRRTSGQTVFLPSLLEMEARLSCFSALPIEKLDTAILPHFESLSRSLLHAPHYHELFSRQGLGPRDLCGPGDLQHFPVLSRDVLREDSFRLVRQDGQGSEREGLVAVRSSGSTGQPVTVYKSRLECLLMWGVLRFWMRWFKTSIPARPRSVLLCTLPGGLEYSVRVPVLANGALHRISTSSPRVIEKLEKARPVVLFTNPEGLHWLLSQKKPPRPGLLLSSAQYLAPELRSEVTRSLGAPVVNYYASTETGPIGWECDQRPGSFHVLLPDLWVESRGGELLVTRLRPSPFLLLRYRIGDRGEVCRDSCGCGYSGLTITNLSGRCQTRFVTPGGSQVDPWKLAYLFKYQPLRSFRLIQRGASDFDLEIFSEKAPDEFDKLVEELVEAVRRLGFESPRLTLCLHGEERERAAKADPFARTYEPAAPLP